MVNFVPFQQVKLIRLQTFPINHYSYSLQTIPQSAVTEYSLSGMPKAKGYMLTEDSFHIGDSSKDKIPFPECNEISFRL